ncbi:MAG: SPFH domain-containing protein [Candidatus Coprenecus sp.]|nr:SPFH domain-containing protein [Candidatus Coprenecus sp.]
MQTNGQERPYKGFIISGFVMLLLGLALIIAGAYTFYLTVSEALTPLVTVGFFILAILSLVGLFKLEPNEAKVMVFFGVYKGTFQKTGFFWVNPFMTKKTVSLRVRNLNPEPIKVNDKSGNPILIGMVLVWKLEDSYKAMFEVDTQSLNPTPNSKGEIISGSVKLATALEKFVRVQSDAALRQVAGCYAYDNTQNEEELSLRSNADEINLQLVASLNERLSMAGIKVLEARINYLAYAPEIAAVMLRRQQADAIIAAREKIVQGAVSMVKMALDNLKEDGVVELDEERKAAMVSNLLVVLCGDQPAQPVVNSGSLY